MTPCLLLAEEIPLKGDDTYLTLACSIGQVGITNQKSTNNIRTLPEGCSSKVAHLAHSSMPNCGKKSSLLISALRRNPTSIKDLLIGVWFAFQIRAQKMRSTKQASSPHNNFQQTLSPNIIKHQTKSNKQEVSEVRYYV